MSARPSTIFGAILVLAGALLCVADMSEAGRNVRWFVVPAVTLIGLGAMLIVLGVTQRDGPG